MTGCEPTEVRQLRQYSCPCKCHIKDNIPSPCSTCSCWELVLMPNRVNYTGLHPKPTLGLFGNETQNLIHQEMIDAIYKRIEALEKYREDNSTWTSSRTITENAVYLKVSQLEQERDKGVERLKKLEECAELQSKTNPFLQNQINSLNKFFVDLRTDFHATAENVNINANRLEALEKKIDLELIEKIIFDGANLHATILKYEARMEALESNLSQKNSVIVKAQDHIADASKKVVTIYEAIKALREGKKIKRVGWPENDWLKIYNFIEVKTLIEDDDWVIEDE